MAVKNLTKTALLTALIALIAPWTLPVGAVPITLGSFAVALASALIGLKGTCATGIYILLGALGLPIFAGFQGGVHILLSPTGGFIIGYLLLSVAVALLYDSKPTFTRLIVSQLAGYALLYMFGIVVFILVTGSDVLSAIAACVLPFVVGDILKVICVALIAPRIRKLLR